MITCTFWAGFNVPKLAARQRKTEMTATSTPITRSPTPMINPRSSVSAATLANATHARAFRKDAAASAEVCMSRPNHSAWYPMIINDAV